MILHDVSLSILCMLFRQRIDLLINRAGIWRSTQSLGALLTRKGKGSWAKPFLVSLLHSLCHRCFVSEFKTWRKDVKLWTLDIQTDSPWAGVTLNDVAVPEIWAAWADRVIAAVLSLFAFESFATMNSEYLSLLHRPRQHSPRLLASPIPARTLPVPTPMRPRPLVWSNAPTSSSASPNAIRFWSLRSSVWA